jgi:hypothetical protein
MWEVGSVGDGGGTRYTQGVGTRNGGTGSGLHVGGVGTEEFVHVVLQGCESTLSSSKH